MFPRPPLHRALIAAVLVFACAQSACSNDEIPAKGAKTDAGPADVAAADAAPDGGTVADAAGTDPDQKTDAASTETTANDAADLADAATPEGCPAKPGCPCKTDKQCDDGDACTADDTCVSGTCGFPAPTNCDDANVCTDDFCYPASGCTSTTADLDALPCNDSNVCTLDDFCAGGVCKGGKKRLCNDGNKCTSDLCTGGLGCAFAHNNIECRAGNACIEPSLCSFGGCPGSKTVPCNDKNACTYDTCTPASGCETLALPAPATSCDGTEQWGRCFKAIKTSASWVEARVVCRQWGGELVSILDRYDNQLVRGLADNACGKAGAWIGLTDVAREYGWIWSDGTRYGFRAWNKGEPNNSGNEDYTEIVPGGGWNDLGDKHKRGCLICSRPMRVPCSDGDACSTGSACHLYSNVTATAATGTGMGAGNLGNVGAALPTCATGTSALDCDDQTPCTADSCHPKTGCAHKPLKDGTKCAAGTCSKGICNWPESKVFTSCKDALAKDSTPSGVYTLLGTDKAGKATKYKAWCEMGGKWGGGWTLVMQVNGKSSTFNWASKLWRDKQLHNEGKAPWIGIDAKLASYWSVAGKELLLVMQTGKEQRAVQLPIAVTVNGKLIDRSLHAVMTPGKHVKTTLDYKKWRALIPNSSLQSNCHAQGFNVLINGAGRARIGIIGNNENECNTPDSWLGVGGHEKMCSNKPVKSAGNVACYYAENGTRRIATFAWLLVR